MKRGEHTQLVVWQKGMELVNQIYSVTKSFPKDELFGLTSQLRRAGCSIPINIAEGNSRLSDKDFKRFLQIAYGSVIECETALQISLNQKYIPIESFNTIMKQCKTIRKMINGLADSL